MNKDRVARPAGETSRLTLGLLGLLGVGIVCAGLFVVGALIFRLTRQNEGGASTPLAAATFTPRVVIPTLTGAPAATGTSAVATPAPSDTPVPVATSAVISTTAPLPSPSAAIATAPPAAPTAEPTKKPRMARMRSPDYGMQAFLWWRAEVAQRDVEMVRDAGFRWVKQAFSWREIEGKGKGQYDWTIPDRIVEQVRGVGPRLIARLDSEPGWASGQTYPNSNNVMMSPPRNYQDFFDFCYNVAARYEGRIAAYQVWNEPNLAREWGGQAPDPAAYTRLLKGCYEGIKRGDPYAIVISAGMAPTTRNDKVARPDTEFLKGMYAAGAARYFDALGAHGAGYKAPPEMDPADVSTNPDYYNKGDVNCPGPACRIYCFRHVEDLRQIMVQNGDTDKRVIVLEFGWTIDSRPGSPYGWHAVTEDQQADYFVRAYQYAQAHWQPWIGVMSLIYMPNIDWTENDEQYWWSIAVPNYPQFLPRKAYRDLAVMPKE